MSYIDEDAPLSGLARIMSLKGRDGDTMLAHINPMEAKMLQAMGGRGSLNPQTGLPEFAWGDDDSDDDDVGSFGGDNTGRGGASTAGFADAEGNISWGSGSPEDIDDAVLDKSWAGQRNKGVSTVGVYDDKGNLDTSHGPGAPEFFTGILETLFSLFTGGVGDLELTGMDLTPDISRSLAGLRGHQPMGLEVSPGALGQALGPLGALGGAVLSPTIEVDAETGKTRAYGGLFSTEEDPYSFSPNAPVDKVESALEKVSEIANDPIGKTKEGLASFIDKVTPDYASWDKSLTDKQKNLAEYLGTTYKTSPNNAQSGDSGDDRIYPTTNRSVVSSPIQEDVTEEEVLYKRVPNPAYPITQEGLLEAAIKGIDISRYLKEPYTVQAATGGGIGYLANGSYGMIRDDGTGDGMSDNVSFPVDGDSQINEVRVSPDEYVIDAHTVAALGNGSSEAGAKVLDKAVAGIRSSVYDRGKQPKQINGLQEFTKYMNV